VQDGNAVLRPAEELDLSRLVRTFTLRTSEGFVESFGGGLIARVGRQAPGVRLRFVQKPDKDSTPLRDATVDLETGVVGKTTGPEVRAQALFRDRFVGVVRRGHALSRGKMTPARYAAGRHILVSRRGLDKGPIDEALNRLRLEREIVTIVGGFSTALSLARASDLIASVPERHTGSLRAGMHSFPLPVSFPEITVSLLWHPRLDADPAHRWLRRCVRDACGEQLTGSSPRRRSAKAETRQAQYGIIDDVTTQKRRETCMAKGKIRECRGRSKHCPGLIRLRRHFGDRRGSQELRQGAREGHGRGRGRHAGGPESEAGEEKTSRAQAKDEGREKEADHQGSRQKEASLIRRKR